MNDEASKANTREDSRSQSLSGLSAVEGLRARKSLESGGRAPKGSCGPKTLKVASPTPSREGRVLGCRNDQDVGRTELPQGRTANEFPAIRRPFDEEQTKAAKLWTDDNLFAAVGISCRTSKAVSNLRQRGRLDSRVCVVCNKHPVSGVYINYIHYIYSLWTHLPASS